MRTHTDVETCTEVLSDLSKVPEGADTFQLPAIEWQTTPNLEAHNYKSTDFFNCVCV